MNLCICGHLEINHCAEHGCNVMDGEVMLCACFAFRPVPLVIEEKDFERAVAENLALLKMPHNRRVQ